VPRWVEHVDREDRRIKASSAGLIRLFSDPIHDDVSDQFFCANAGNFQQIISAVTIDNQCLLWIWQKGT